MPNNDFTSTLIDEPSRQRIWLSLVPYITVGVGLLWWKNAWIAMVSYHLVMIIVLFLARAKINIRQWLSGKNYRIIAAAVGMGGAGGLLLYVLWPLLGISNTINLSLQNMGLNATTWPYFIVYFILVNGCLEEFYWRGYLGSHSKGIILSDFLFAGYHLIVLAGRMEIIWVVMVFIVLLLGAWFWRQANRWNQGISASLASHIAADASIILTIYLMTWRI
jgi:membrane protease YdiL (CAAX protease family)